MKLYQRWLLVSGVCWFFGPILYSLVDWMDGSPGFVHLYWCFAIWAWVVLIIGGIAAIGGTGIFLYAKVDEKEHYE
jgi:hypothetical protein